VRAEANRGEIHLRVAQRNPDVGLLHECHTMATREQLGSDRFHGA
jgi:hypothetical protein